MALKKTYATQEEIPEALRDIYAEQEDGSYVLDVEGGLKTDQDVVRLKGALDNEKAEHRKTKQKYAQLGDITPEVVQQLRDQVEDLTAQVAAGGKPDEKALEPLIQRRAEALVRPVKRELETAIKERDTLKGEAETLRTSDRRRRLGDALEGATRGEKGVKLRAPSVLEDARLMAERIFEEDATGAFVTRDGVGITPGLSPSEWLREVQAQGLRPHWFPENEGAGADASRRRGGDGVNPLMGDKPNLTEFARIMRADPKKAVRFARAAKRLDLIPKSMAALA